MTILKSILIVGSLMTGDRGIDYNTFQPHIRRISSPNYPPSPLPSGLSPEAELAAQEIIEQSSDSNAALSEHLEPITVTYRWKEGELFPEIVLPLPPGCDNITF